MKEALCQIINAISGYSNPQKAEGDYAVIPENHKLEDLQKFQEGPRHIKSKAQVTTCRSFVKYVADFYTDYTAIFADLKGQKFTAILDHHDPLNGPAWAEHTVTYACPVDSRWTTWNDSDGEAMSQTSFAMFIESNLIDIVEPSGADMLTIAKELQAKKKIDFKSGQNLSNGDVQFTYNEQTTGTAGSMEIPQEFKLGIPVYEGGDPYEVTARLRYRISEGNLTMWYDLLRPERMAEDAFKEIKESIEKQLADKATFFDGRTNH